MRTSSLILLVIFLGCSKPKNDSPIKTILLEQLINTHNNKDWFVPLNIAIEDISDENARWADSSGNHSICEIVSHITFWNERILLAFQSKPTQEYNDNNDETFTRYCFESWEKTTFKSDSIQTAWEEVMMNSTKDQLEEWSSSISNMTSHTAYHIGQIVYIRKQNGWWNESMGVK